MRPKSLKQKENLSLNAFRRFNKGDRPMWSTEAIIKRNAASSAAAKKPENRKKNSDALLIVLRKPEVRQKRSKAQQRRFSLARIQKLQQNFDRKFWYDLILKCVRVA